MTVSKPLRRQKAKTACASSLRQTRMRSRLSCAAPLMSGLDARGQPIGTLPEDPLNIPYNEVLKLLPRPKIILRVKSSDAVSCKSRASSRACSKAGTDVSQDCHSDTSSESRYSSNTVSEDSEHDRVMWKMPLWQKGSVIAGPPTLMQRLTGYPRRRKSSTSFDCCSPKTMPKQRPGRVAVMLNALPRVDTSCS